MCSQYLTRTILTVFFSIFSLGAIGQSNAAQVKLAVASNALAAVKVISAEFEKETGNNIVISSGSTGKLYSQIINGAPFDIFFAANEREPQRLEQSGLIVPDSRFTYAMGKLVAWSVDKTLLQSSDDQSRTNQSSDIKSVLISEQVKRIAIANPKIAPYGLAAQQTLQKLAVWQAVQSKIIRGENVSQTYQFAISNNAQIGFVAKSQITSNDAKQSGSYWEVPQELYSPIRQQAVLLLKSKQKQAASAFLDFMKSNSAKKILTNKFGYGVEQPGDAG